MTLHTCTHAGSSTVKTAQQRVPRAERKQFIAAAQVEVTRSIFLSLESPLIIERRFLIATSAWKTLMCAGRQSVRWVPMQHGKGSGSGDSGIKIQRPTQLTESQHPIVTTVADRGRCNCYLLASHTGKLLSRYC